MFNKYQKDEQNNLKINAAFLRNHANYYNVWKLRKDKNNKVCQT